MAAVTVIRTKATSAFIPRPKSEVESLSDSLLKANAFSLKLSFLRMRYHVLQCFHTLTSG